MLRIVARSEPNTSGAEVGRQFALVPAGEVSGNAGLVVDRVMGIADEPGH
jgi:hypothetical protein